MKNCQTANNVYVGARYVPKIMGEWSATVEYEPLSVVLYQGTSYTSITYVPMGILPTDEKYWALTGNYNAQVEQYRQEVERIKNQVDMLTPLINKTYDTTLLMINDNNLKDGDIVQTLGYYTINDGGGAIIKIETIDISKISGGYIQINSTLMGEIIVDDEINVKQLGAKGDDVNDDTSAFVKASLSPYDIFIPNGSYLVNNSLTFNKKRNIRGSGALTSIVKYSGIDNYFLTLKTNTTAWYSDMYNISNLTIRSQKGTIKLINATQSIIENCSLYSPNAGDVNNIFISNESHYCSLLNNFIYGGNGITCDASNGVRIEQNYINYTNNAITINGGHHNIINNDVEGYNKIPYNLNCSSSNIIAHGERNTTGTWIKLTGNANNITIGMQSDGGSFYNPLCLISGNYNNININGCTGYRLFNDVTGVGNKIEVKTSTPLTNYIMFPYKTNIITNDIIMGKGTLLFDNESDSVGISKFATTTAEIDYTYDNINKNVVIKTTNGMRLDLSSLFTSGIDKIYVYYEFQGISSAEQGEIYMYNETEGGNGFPISGRICCMLKKYSHILTPPKVVNASFKILKFRISTYMCENLVK